MRRLKAILGLLTGGVIALGVCAAQGADHPLRVLYLGPVGAGGGGPGSGRSRANDVSLPGQTLAPEAINFDHLPDATHLTETSLGHFDAMVQALPDAGVGRVARRRLDGFKEAGHGLIKYPDGNFAARVESAEGAPAGGPSLKEAYREHFLVGVAVNRGIVMGTPLFRRPVGLVSSDIETTRAQFNQITAENDMKWQLIHPGKGADGYDFGPADAFVEFGVSNRLQIVGHTLVWHSQTPDWVFAGTNPAPALTHAAPLVDGGTNVPGTNRAGPRGPGFGGGQFGRYAGPRASREELLQRMHDHIQAVVGRYRGKVRTWDVVNEAIADGGGTNILRNSLWLEIIGPDFIARAFQYAHEADPGAILRYNDYGLENPAKRRKLVTLIRSLQEQKVPVHAIGSQAHVNVGTTFETMDQALAEMATLGLPIHVTELDVNGAQGGQNRVGADIAGNAAATQGGLVNDADRKLADAYAGLFRAFLRHRDSVKMVTFWGVNDAVSWRANGRPLLFDGDNRPKPAFEAVISEAAKAEAGR